jgi:hypothetical protein
MRKLILITFFRVNDGRSLCTPGCGYSEAMEIVHVRSTIDVWLAKGILGGRCDPYEFLELEISVGIDVKT